MTKRGKGKPPSWDASPGSRGSALQQLSEEQQQQLIYEALTDRGSALLGNFWTQEEIDADPKLLKRLQDAIKRAVDEHMNLQQQMLPVLLSNREGFCVHVEVVKPSVIDLGPIATKADARITVPLKLRAGTLTDQMDWLWVYSIVAEASLRALLYALGYKLKFTVDAIRDEKALTS